MSDLQRMGGMGLADVGARLDLETPRGNGSPPSRLGSRRPPSSCSVSQGRGAGPGIGTPGRAPPRGRRDRRGGTRSFEADAVLLVDGSRPRMPDWADRRRRPGPHDPRGLPAEGAPRAPGGHRLGRHRRRVRAHVRARSAREVTLIVSRQQVLPRKDPEVAAALEEDFIRRGVQLLKGARATGIDRDGRRRRGAVRRRAGRRGEPRAAGHRVGPQHRGPRPGEPPGSRSTPGGYVPINHHCQTNVAHIYAAGDLSGKLPLSSVASMQGRKIAEHVVGRHTGGAPAPQLRQGAPRPSSPSPRSPTSVSPRRRPSPRAGRSG